MPKPIAGLEVTGMDAWKVRAQANYSPRTRCEALPPFFAVRVQFLAASELSPQGFHSLTQCRLRGPIQLA